MQGQKNQDKKKNTKIKAFDKSFENGQID